MLVWYFNICYTNIGEISWSRRHAVPATVLTEVESQHLKALFKDSILRIPWKWYWNLVGAYLKHWKINISPRCSVSKSRINAKASRSVETIHFLHAWINHFFFNGVQFCVSQWPKVRIAVIVRPCSYSSMGIIEGSQLLFPPFWQ